MSEDRRLEVLRAIVHDYVATSEPVGSKALLERHRLGVSAATIRNDMAALEDDGLIAAPHTSAGRVPTDAGYRLFVDRLSQVKPMSSAERSAIQTFLAQAVDVDDVVDRTVRLLSSLTQQVAVMQYPSLNTATVRHVELVALGADRVMVVLILSTGRVEQRVMQVSTDLTDPSAASVLSELRAKINAAVSGQRRAAAAGVLPGLVVDVRPADQAVAGEVLGGLATILTSEREERVALAGTANLARSVHDFPMTLSPVLDALEEHVVLLKLLSQMGAENSDAVAVRIGSENPVEGLQTASVVSAAYSPGDVSGLGVLGPTRMDYPSTMAAVHAVARYVSKVLDQ